MSTGTIENGQATVPANNGNGNVITQQPKQRLIVRDESQISFLMDTAKFEHLYRIAQGMARCSFMPQHLLCERDGKNWKPLAAENQVANCLLVVNQAIRWNMDPFAVAPETYVVSGKLGFQGKLVAAVVNTRSNLQGRLRVSYVGAGDDRTATVTGRFADETEDRQITLSIRQAKTDNQMWRTDPDQKLWYSAVTKWARRHCPEVLLGVLTDDDVDRIAADSMPLIEPPKGETTAARITSQLQQRFAANSQPETVEGSVTETKSETETETATVSSVGQSTDIDPIESLRQRIEAAMTPETLFAIEKEINNVADDDARCNLFAIASDRRKKLPGA